MSGSGFEVPAMSWAEIDDITETLRRRADTLDKPYFPIGEYLELVMSNQLRLFDIEVISRDEMPGEFATVSRDGRVLKIREDVYEDVWRGTGHARFTLAHELGHMVLHCTGVEVYALATGQRVPGFRDSEAQANHFASTLLMPKKFFSSSDTVETVSRRHGVSRQAALLRLKYLSAKGFLRLPPAPRFL